MFNIKQHSTSKGKNEVIFIFCMRCKLITFLKQCQLFILKQIHFIFFQNAYDIVRNVVLFIKFFRKVQVKKATIQFMIVFFFL